MGYLFPWYLVFLFCLILFLLYAFGDLFSIECILGDIFPYSVDCYLVQMIVTLAVQTFCSFMRSLIVDLRTFANGILLRSLFLWQWVRCYSTLSLLSESVYLALYFLCSIWIWVLCRVISTDLFELFYMWLSILTSTICFRCCFIFYRVYFWLLLKNISSIYP